MDLFHHIVDNKQNIKNLNKFLIFLLFYNQLLLLEPRTWEDFFAFVNSCGQAFFPAYVLIVEKRRSTEYGDRERQLQLYRRGYVEFNLVYDRRTILGLQTNGRTESILMSLPPLVR